MGKANSTGILSVRGKDRGLFRPLVRCQGALLPAICSWLRIVLLPRLPQNSVSLGTTLGQSPETGCLRIFFLGYRTGPLPCLGLFHPFTPKSLILLLLFCFVDATKITLAPSSADINVGDNLTLQCHASHDPTMDLTFTWTLDDFPIDFDKPGSHYRRASVVRPEGLITLPSSR